MFSVSHFAYISSLNPCNSAMRLHYHPHFIEEETESEGLFVQGYASDDFTSHVYADVPALTDNP